MTIPHNRSIANPGAFYTDTDQDKALWTVGTTFLGDSVFGGYLSAGF